MDYNVDEWDGKEPLPSLYAKTAGDAINIWTCWIEGCHVHMRWGQVDGAMQTGNYVCAPKNCGRANATTAEEQARLEAISRWKKQLKKKYFMQLEEAQTGFNLKPMLAKVFKDVKKVTFPASLQPKYDGLRCLAYRKDGKVFLQSRGGDPYRVAHIIEELEKVLPEGLLLDGELYRHNTPLQTINSWVRRPQPDSLLVEYHVYDCVRMDQENEMKWPERKALLDWWFSHLPEHSSVYPVETWTVASKEEVKAKHDELVQAGFEGAIVRLHTGQYRFGYRSSELLKVKEFQDAEFLIVGWNQKKVRYVGAAEVVTPCFICRTEAGATFEVVPMGSHEERQRYFAEAESHVGKQLTVRFFNWTPDGLPFLPVGVAIREPGA
jgi:DNA ligase-1